MKKIISWLKTRFGLRPILEEVVLHRVTRTPWWQSDGGALAFLFGVLLVTGAAMSLTYSPAPETAYDSVQQITQHNVLGWLVRAIHYWSAGMLMIVMLIHLFRHILMGGYLPPREGTWLLGVGLLILFTMNSFIGYTLRWDERSVYAIRVALNIFYQVPFIGDELVQLVQGGWGLSANTLSRLYSMHVVIIPLGISALIFYHLYLVVMYGVTTRAEQRVSSPPETAEEQIALRDHVKNTRGQEFFPYTAVHNIIYSTIVFSIVLLLSFVYGPQELYPKANLTRTSFPQEEWWFSWYSTLTAYLPPSVAPHFHWLFPIVLFGALILMPFVDRGSNRGFRRRPLAFTFVLVSAVALIGLAGLRIKSPWTSWPQDHLPPLPPTAELTAEAERGRKAFVKYGCYNCHAIGSESHGVGPNLAGLDKRLSHQEFRSIILDPPPDFAMPAYKGHITEEDLENVLAFVMAVQTWPHKFPGAKK